MTDEHTRQGLIASVRQVYLSSRKKRDITWNTYIARPLAAVLVHLLASTPLTPNQVSFLGALIFLGVPAALLLNLGALGLIIAALILQLAYVFDCADGQLARHTGKTSPVGAYLDFFIDEVKALLLVAACGVRLWLVFDHAAWLLATLAGVLLVAIATSLTTFVRRPQYAGQEIMPGVHAEPKKPTSVVGRLIALFESCAKYLIHYPSWFSFVAIAGIFWPNEATIAFLTLFLGVYAVYTAKTGLAVLVKLGRPSFYSTQ